MPITLKRTLTDVDWHALSHLYQLTLGHDEPDQLQRTWARSYAATLAYDGPRLVAAARALSDGEREALIVGVAVLPEYQRRGIGTAVMRDLMEQVKGCAVVLTSAEDENTPFYRALGFRTHKRAMVHGYPTDVTVD